jgi:cell wall-associated NlpC family hydrolase
MRRFFRIITALALVLILTVSPVSAQFFATGTTTANQLRLREHPSLSARVLDTVPRGTTVSITQEDTIVNQDGVWYHVIHDGVWGFMSAEFLSVVQNGTYSNGDETECDVFVAIARTTGSLRLRATASLSGRILSTAPRGSSVAITQRTPIVNQDGSWYPVVYNGDEGFMSADFLNILQNGQISGEVGFTNGNTVNLRSGPSTGSERIRSLSRHTRVEITGIRNGWYAVRQNDTDGFIRSDLVLLATGGFNPAAPRPAAASVSSSSNSNAHAKALSTLNSAGVTDTRRSLVETALTHLGKPYRWGSAGPNSFDCSGFVFFIYGQFGHRINRSSVDQYRNTGTRISKGDLLPGDLVFFRTSNRNVVSHSGIYIGGGQFIHASTTRRGIIISPINTGYYRERYVGAKRVLR